MRIHRLLRRAGHQISLLSSDSLIQFTSLVFLVVMMTTEGLRASLALSQQIAMESERLYVQKSSFAKMREHARPARVLLQTDQGRKYSKISATTATLGASVNSMRTADFKSLRSIQEKGRKSLGSWQDESGKSSKKKRQVETKEKQRRVQRKNSSSVLITVTKDSGPNQEIRTLRTATQKKSSPASTLSKLSTKKQVSSNQNSSQAGQQHFRGVRIRSLKNYMNKSDNITRVSFMMYRLVKAYNVTSILDVPCKKSLPWLPQLVHHLEYEVPGFKYYCILQSDKEYASAKKKVGNMNSLVLLIRPEFWNFPLPKADLAFLWNALGFLAPEKSWKLLQVLQKLDVTFVAVPNFPLVERNSGHSASHGRVNVRRSPYRFGEPARIVQKVGHKREEPKQLLLYYSKSIRAKN